MKFEEALEFLKEGERIRRKGECGWLTLNNGVLLCYTLNSDRIGKLVSCVKQLSLEDVCADDWEVVEEKKKWWEPKVNEQYFYIRSTGILDYNNCDNDTVDKLFQSFGNCFQTVKEAKFVAEKLKVIHELEKFAYENNEEEIDWNNKDQRKYYLILTCTGGKNRDMDATYTFELRSVPFNVYFTSEEIARKAIETIGEERIKKYYFGVNEDGRK